jgi:hypothetical protein
VLNALNAALRSAPAADQDAATVALAKRYALELDDAAVVSTAMTKALRQLSRTEVDMELYEKFEALAARIEEVHVTATFGPKLLAALEQLQLTPKARSAVAAGGGAPRASSTALDQLRERRQNRAKTVDPAST